MTDTRLFLRSLLRNPRRLGAVAPSGRALANLMTAELPTSDEPIIELGPGTGAFTDVLIARGVPEHRLALIEADPVFAQALRIKFPRARVLTMDATHLGAIEGLFDEPAGAVVSGLPLVAMTAEQVASILTGVFRHLSPRGALFQFTYLPRCPVPWRVLHRMELDANRFGCAWANLPPAFVYRIRRASYDWRRQPPSAGTPSS